MFVFTTKNVFIFALQFICLTSSVVIDKLPQQYEAQKLSSSAATHHRVKRIVGGRQAKAPPPDDPVIFTRTFNRDARVEGFRNSRTGIYSFLGLHYAEPPTGQNRYARPIFKRLAGDINATKHGPPCIQPDPYKPSRIIGDENCLLLNVYTPQMPDESTGLPVFVWIHPGGFRYGSAAQYDATPMAQRGVIVVAPQYRLGTLGIIGDGTKQFDGNLAIFDMAAALRWVTDYISYFGGNPKQVQAIGHGSGAASAMYLSMSRSARSATDISGVIAMSGTALSQYATDKEPVQSVEEIAKINGCPTINETEIVKCLRQKTAEEIIQNDSKVQTERLAGRMMVQGLSGNVGFQPHIEGEDDRRGLPGLIVDVPETQLRNSKFTPIPLLTGVTKHETANAFTIEAINNVFGTVNQFLGALTSPLEELTGFLRVDEVTGKIAKPILPGLTKALTPTLEQLLKVSETLALDQVLAKVVESTTDVLFNLPAVLTQQVWSKIAPAFMYSFEYNGTKSKGIHFLRGLPIVADTQNSNSEVVAHGDELGYMFDANDIYGNPIEAAKLTEAADLKVRENIITMLVEFAKSFSGNDTTSKKSSASLFKSLTGKGTSFIKVNAKLETGNDFRFCELSVLGAALTPLAATTCQGLDGLLNPVMDVVSGLGLGNATNALGLSGVGGLLGGGSGGGSGKGGGAGAITSGIGGLLGGGKKSPNRLSSVGNKMPTTGGLLGSNTGLLAGDGGLLGGGGLLG